jgi:hypothetical protein
VVCGAGPRASDRVGPEVSGGAGKLCDVAGILLVLAVFMAGIGSCFVGPGEGRAAAELLSIGLGHDAVTDAALARDLHTLSTCLAF